MDTDLGFPSVIDPLDDPFGHQHRNVGQHLSDVPRDEAVAAARTFA